MKILLLKKLSIFKFWSFISFLFLTIKHVSLLVSSKIWNKKEFFAYRDFICVAPSLQKSFMRALPNLISGASTLANHIWMSQRDYQCSWGKLHWKSCLFVEENDEIFFNFIDDLIFLFYILQKKIRIVRNLEE